MKNSAIEVSCQERETVLGLLWEPSPDNLVFDAKFNFTKNQVKENNSHPGGSKFEIPTILTRRMLLRQTATIYDPLGLIVPFTVQGKILLRNLTTRQDSNRLIYWDEPIPKENKSEWIVFLTQMLKLDTIRFGRCIKPSNSVGEPILVAFSDASSQAYRSIFSDVSTTLGHRQ